MVNTSLITSTRKWIPADMVRQEPFRCLARRLDRIAVISQPKILLLLKRSPAAVLPTAPSPQAAVMSRLLRCNTGYKTCDYLVLGVSLRHLPRKTIIAIMTAKEVPLDDFLLRHPIPARTTIFRI